MTSLPGIGTAIGVISALIYRVFPTKKGALYNHAKELLHKYATALDRKDTKTATITLAKLNELLEKAEQTDGEM